MQRSRTIGRICGQTGGGVKNSLYLLFGKESFLKKECVASLRAKFFPNGAGADFNFRSFTAAENALSELTDFLLTAPFLSEKRLAVLWEADGLSPEEKETLLECLGRLPASAALVVVSEEGSVKKDGFLKALSEQATTVACHAPFEKDFPAWIESRAKQSGCSIQRTALIRLLEQAGRDLAVLSTALETLSLFIHPRTQILAEDIDGLLGKSVEADIFSLVDNLMDKNAAAALETTTSLLREGTRAYEMVSILAGQFERLRKASALLAEGRRPEEVGAQFRVHPFFLDKFVRQAKKIPHKTGVRLVTGLLACDETIKSGKLNERLALEKLIVELCA